MLFRYHHARARGGRRREERAHAVDVRGPVWLPVKANPSAGSPDKAGPKTGRARWSRLAPGCPEKPLSDDGVVPVPQTDTGRQVEDTKAIE